VPIFPGSEGAIEDEDEAAKVADEIGYPVIIKAAAGGGGRGMRVCHNEATLRTNLKQRLAGGAGGLRQRRGLHREVPRARAARRGAGARRQARHAIHLYERDCSMQRRHQKVIEEAPGPGIDRRKRDGVCEAAAG
jgi:acetyl-CoA carboxylase, biotin carboxylase subunit